MKMNNSIDREKMADGCVKLLNEIDNMSEEQRDILVSVFKRFFKSEYDSTMEFIKWNEEQV